MRAVDTSAWIEWLADSATGRRLAPKLPAKNVWLVPTIVQMALMKWATRELSRAQARRALLFSDQCFVVDLDTTLAVDAANLCIRHKLATADAIVYATALAHGADLLTCDAHFRDLPGVVYLPKTTA